MMSLVKIVILLPLQRRNLAIVEAILLDILGYQWSGCELLLH